MKTRLIITFSLASIGLGLNAGCQQNSAKLQSVVGVGTTKPDLFGLPPEYRALHAAMENTLGRPVRFNAQPNGAAIGRQLEMGNVSFAIMSAAEYANAPDRDKLSILATATNSMNKPTRKAYVIARATDARFKEVGDCKEKRFAFGTYHDPLTDYLARKTLEANGVPLNKILPELLPPPLAMEGRLYANNAASAISLDLTVNAGVIDEVMWSKLPETGGNPLTGPSRDQFKIIGETQSIPELAFVAGPSADPTLSQKVKDLLINKVKDDPKIREQLGVAGFVPGDRAAYDAVAPMLVTK